VGDVLQLGSEKQLLKQYYAGQQMKSPNDGGFLILLGVRAAEGGSATAMFECSVSSLRYEIPIPKATRGERKTVKDVIDAGDDPDCPRHGFGTRLVRAGRDYICRDCGVPYGRV
jgi:hypothetical protein